MRRVVLIIIVTATFLLAGFGLGRASAQVTPIPGSPQDPLVTKSYVDSAIQAAMAQLQQSLSQLVSQDVQQLVGSSGQGQGSTSFQVVTVAAGSTIIGDASTELIVRAGVATAVVSAAGGVSDLTGGRDLAKGAVAPPNHLLLIPRTDGRGLHAKTTLIVLVSGAYTISP